jgi:hypothetical protein
MIEHEIIPFSESERINLSFCNSEIQTSSKRNIHHETHSIRPDVGIPGFVYLF